MWALVVFPLLLVLGAVVVVGWRPRRVERQRRAAQLTSVFNAKARRPRGDEGMLLIAATWFGEAHAR